jgi:N-carbamoyl-L-amino-acid hydrolase
MNPAAIDPTLLDRLFTAVSTHGATPAGGVHRPAATAADGAARDWLAGWLREAGLTVKIDPIGNMFGVLEWAGPDAPSVMVGSHIDSQPNGGCYDGAYGVVAACTAVQAVRQTAVARGVRPLCNLVIVNWTNEEGARFQPSLMGSGVYAGQLGLADALGRRDGEGVSVGEALAEIGYAGTDRQEFPRAYLEVHVECAAALETAGERFGIFTRYWGAIKYRLAYLGEQAHTGPTPMALRKDALLAAAHLMVGLRAVADASGLALHTSVGRLEVSPNSPNIVPGEAVMFIELRSPDPAVLAQAERDLVALIAESGQRAGVGHEVRSIDRRRPGPADARLIALAERCAGSAGVSSRHLATIAGHDAYAVGQVAPALVIAVPSVGGVCHHPSEFTQFEDLALGTDILAHMLWTLCTVPEALAGLAEGGGAS